MARQGVKARLRAFLKSGSAKILSDAGWVMLLRVLRQTLALLVTAVLVRVVSKYEFGEYQFALTMMGALTFTSLLGVQRAIVQAVARGYPGTFRVGTRLAFRASFVGAAILAGLAGWFWWTGHEGQAMAVAAGALVFPASQGLNQWQSLQIGRREFRRNTIRVSIGVISASIATIVTALVGLTEPWMLVGATYGVLAIQNSIQQRIGLSSIPREAEPEPGSISYGLKSSLWDAINVVANYIDRIFIFALGSPLELAAYAVADRIPEQIKSNVQQLQAVMVPRFAERDQYTRQLDNKLNRAGLVAAVLILTFAFGLLPYLFPLLYTDGYASSVIYCQLILVSVAIGTFATVKNSFIGAKLDLKGQRNILVGSAIVRLVSSAILVWWLGALGAALSTIVYRITTFTLTETHIRRHYLVRDADG